MANEWNIRARGHTCQSCEKDFTDGEMCFSALHVVISASDGEPILERVDRCAACWKKISTALVASQWQSPYRAPEPPAPDPTPRQTVESLLRRLMEGSEAVAHEAEIYMLAVMLERKKILLERDVRRQDDGSLLRIYEYRKTGEVFLIPDPGLTLSEIEPVQERIVMLLTPPAEKSE